MRKISGIFILIVSLITLGLAMNQSFINKIKSEKYFDHLYPKMATENALYKALFVHSDRWRYGDLYGLSYLHQYKFELEPFTQYPAKTNGKSTNRVLYIIGDSFLADKTLTGAFDAFDNVIFLDRRFPFGPVRLDSTKQNYLIMEFTERNLNGYDINKTDEIKWSAEQIKTGANFNKQSPAAGTQSLPSSLTDRINKILFNRDLSRNLELILFDNKTATPFKEAKAALNYKLFGRVANEAAVSTDKERLFLNITVDTGSSQSAFRPKTKQSVDSIASNLNLAAGYYRSIGFKKVLLSVIPNSVSVYDQNRMPYNHLLERVEQAVGLPVITVYTIYKTDKRNLYYKSDAHWNPAGMQIWVNETNKVLNSNLN
ncbi:hypothetical protein [Mucilaginibacter celer]|uniref:AlgX/AlgJ SGNH hydrolase-like domain-containing protein n=1 Tax=Mucilaginibacter celer TaxID=2305508 RepID=A0A494W1V2_9SPHI|nr:hypothetical protein [Mucilaginibacter celer]AYL97252.1 hypothetical protein HYN43_018905 [Mucilaginibacter celer]